MEESEACYSIYFDIFLEDHHLQRDQYQLSSNREEHPKSTNQLLNHGLDYVKFQGQDIMESHTECKFFYEQLWQTRNL
jgi:hypothetical protein